MSGSSIDLLSELTGLLLEVDDVASVADAVLGFALRHLGADAAGVARHDDDGVVLLALTSARVEALYAVSTTTPWSAPGPAATTIPDTLTDQAFPDFSRHLESHGVRCFRSAALPSQRPRPVTLDLFSAEPGAFSECPDHAEVVLGYLSVAMNAFARAENLQVAMRSREVIAQAQGIVMERFGLTDEQALGLLRRQSQHSQVKMRDVASGITNRRPPPSRTQDLDDPDDPASWFHP